MFHLRTLLINCIVDFGCTFAQLAARAGVAEKWQAHIVEEARGDVPRQVWISEASEAVELLRSAEFAEQPVRFVCEAQMLLNNVYQVRKRMHEVSAARAPASGSGVSPSGLAALCSRVLSLAAAARLPQPYKGLRADTAEQLYKDMLSETLKVAKAKQDADDTSTPLKAAAARGDIEAAARLLREATAAEREAAFVVACARGRGALLAALPALAAGGVAARAWGAAWERAASKDAAAEMGEGVVEALLAGADGAEGGVDRKYKGWTALMRAADGGHDLAVRRLLEVGARADDADSSGSTPLWRAAFSGHEAVAERLVEAGAVVDRAKNDGMTPLYIAAENGHDAVVQMLLQRGATVDLANNNGSTPLCVAAQMGHDAVV